jgi:hypothetical protein
MASRQPETSTRQQEGLVKAMTWPNEMQDIPPREVIGKMTTRWVPMLQYMQYWVAGEQVDPTTIVPYVPEEPNVPKE